LKSIVKAKSDAFFISLITMTIKRIVEAEPYDRETRAPENFSRGDNSYVEVSKVLV